MKLVPLPTRNVHPVDVPHELDDALLPWITGERARNIEATAYLMAARGDPWELIHPWCQRLARSRCAPPLPPTMAKAAAGLGYRKGADLFERGCDAG